MTANKIGVIAAVVALIVLFSISKCERKPEPKPAPVVHVQPAIVPAKPANEPAKPSVETAPKPAQTPAKRAVIVPAKPVKPTYHRVLPGGKVDGQITCARVRAFVATHSQAQIEAEARRLGVSAAQVAQYWECFN